MIHDIWEKWTTLPRNDSIPGRTWMHYPAARQVTIGLSWLAWDCHISRYFWFGKLSQVTNRVFISSRLPNSLLFLIWEIIPKLQIASSSARDSTSKLETRPWEISSRYFAQRLRIVRVFGLVKTHRTNSWIFCKLSQDILGWQSRPNIPLIATSGWWRRKLAG